MSVLHDLGKIPPPMSLDFGGIHLSVMTLFVLPMVLVLWRTVYVYAAHPFIPLHWWIRRNSLLIQFATGDVSGAFIKSLRAQRDCLQKFNPNFTPSFAPESSSKTECSYKQQMTTVANALLYKIVHAAKKRIMKRRRNSGNVADEIN